MLCKAIVQSVIVHLCRIMIITLLSKFTELIGLYDQRQSWSVPVIVQERGKAGITLNIIKTNNSNIKSIRN